MRKVKSVVAQEALPSPPPKKRSTGLWVVASVLIVVVVVANLLHALCLGIIPWPFKPGEENGGEVPIGEVAITSGDPIDVASQSIDYHGGTIEVTDSSSPLYRLRIEVPEAATEEAVTFTVSYSDIIDVSGLPENASVASKMIEIETSGSEMWNEYKAFDIPVLTTLPYDPSLASGNGSLRFYYYDEESNLLDSAGFAWESPANHTVTFFTGTFSKFVGIWLASWYAARYTFSEYTVDIDFLPSTDGWFIPNYGTYLSSRGNCMGMSCFAKWYFAYRKRETRVGLYNKYREPTDDDTEWRDDATALELATRAQKQMETVLFPVFRRIYVATPVPPGLYMRSSWQVAATWLHGMIVTGQPQLCIVVTQLANGKIGEDRHMMLIYGYDGHDEEFWVYDPNDRGTSRRLPFTFTGGFSQTYRTTGPGRREYNIFLALGYNVFTGTRSGRRGARVLWDLYDSAERKFRDDTLFPTVKLTDATTTPQGTTPTDTDDDGVRDTTENKITLSGTITGGKKDVKSAWLFVNDRAKEKVSVDAGGFSKEVPLRQGDNILIILATDENTRTNWAGYLKETIKCTASKQTITFTLNWFKDKCDLDLHVLEPTIEEEPGRHIYYGNPGETGKYPYLDIDDTDGYGPEHYLAEEDTTLPNYKGPDNNKSLYGTYKVRVHYFADHDEDENNTQIVNWRLDIEYLAFRHETKTPPEEYWNETVKHGVLMVANTTGTSEFDNPKDTSWSPITTVQYRKPDPADYNVPPPPQNRLPP